jgi:hypothetical protein
MIEAISSDHYQLEDEHLEGKNNKNIYSWFFNMLENEPWTYFKASPIQNLPVRRRQSIMKLNLLWINRSSSWT